MRKLPNSRGGITREVTIAGEDLVCPHCKKIVVSGEKQVRLTTGEFEDGSLGEIEIKVGKPGLEDRNYDVCAYFASLALQSEVPVEKIIKHMMYISTEAGGVVKGDNFRICKSIYDWVGKRLKKDYVDNKE